MLLIFDVWNAPVIFPAMSKPPIYNRCNVPSIKAPPFDVTCSKSWVTKTDTAVLIHNGSPTDMTHVT